MNKNSVKEDNNNLENKSSLNRGKKGYLAEVISNAEKPQFLNPANLKEKVNKLIPDNEPKMHVNTIVETFETFATLLEIKKEKDFLILFDKTNNFKGIAILDEEPNSKEKINELIELLKEEK